MTNFKLTHTNTRFCVQDEVCPGSNVFTSVGEESQGTDTCQRNSLKQLPYSESANESQNLPTQQQNRILRISRRKTNYIVELGKRQVNLEKFALVSPTKNFSKECKNLVSKENEQSKVYIKTDNTSDSDVNSSTLFNQESYPEDKQLEEFAQKIEKNILESKNGDDETKQGPWWEKILSKIKK